LQARGAEFREQCRLLIDLLGDRFQPSKAVGPWLEHDGGTALNLARTVYEDRAFDRLPVLADALEEAGCDDPALLEHLRGPGPHVRGCWVLDRLLGLS
jgi:hypothetical protein